jgi:putative SOS response-associated peptidase YedK
MCIAFKGVKLFAMAGLWDLWKAPDGRELGTFAIITTAAGDFMRSIHDRQPLILDPKDWQAWLDPALNNPAKLTALLAPSPTVELTAFEVSTAVNSPNNDIAACIEPVKVQNTKVGLSDNAIGQSIGRLK